MLDNITPFDALLKEADEIDAYLNEPTSEKVEDALERGNMVSELINRTGKMVADAEYHLDSFLTSEIMSILKDTAKQQLPPSIMKKLIDSACKDYNYLAKRCDRLNRASVHKLDWLRTVVSNAKSEREASKGFSNTRSQKKEDLF